MEVRRKVILQHPVYQAGIGWLQVVVWEGSLAKLLRKLGYTEVPSDFAQEIDKEPADKPLDEKRGKEEEDKRS